MKPRRDPLWRRVTAGLIGVTPATGEQPEPFLADAGGPERTVPPANRPHSPALANGIPVGQVRDSDEHVFEPVTEVHRSRATDPDPVALNFIRCCVEAVQSRSSSTALLDHLRPHIAELERRAAAELAAAQTTVRRVDRHTVQAREMGAALEAADAAGLLPRTPEEEAALVAAAAGALVARAVHAHTPEDETRVIPVIREDAPPVPAERPAAEPLPKRPVPAPAPQATVFVEVKGEELRRGDEIEVDGEFKRIAVDPQSLAGAVMVEFEDGDMAEYPAGDVVRVRRVASAVVEGGAR